MSTTMPQLKLAYFDGTGRAELARLLFAYGGIAFEDKRLTHAEMPALKPTLPLGQLPTLEVNGTTYSQSMAIARYAAKLAGLYPHDPVDALRVEMISETLRDLITAFIAVYAEQDAAKKAEATSKFVDATVPSALGVLESMVESKFFLRDDRISLADVHLFDLVQNALVPVFQFSIAPFPKLASVMDNVKATSGITAYLARSTKSV